MLCKTDNGCTWFYIPWTFSAVKKCSKCLPSASVHILTHFTTERVLDNDECGLKSWTWHFLVSLACIKNMGYNNDRSIQCIKIWHSVCKKLPCHIHKFWSGMWNRDFQMGNLVVRGWHIFCTEKHENNLRLKDTWLWALYGLVCCWPLLLQDGI
jgi:hypothetical protein